MPAEILFHTEAGGTALLPPLIPALRRWITATIAARGGKPGAINYIFCGDDYLHEMNVTYLGHDTLTDIITFPYDEFPLVSGDLFISTERVAENAEERQLPYAEELHRVMIHGILHLCGQGDKTEADARVMRAAEEQALATRPPILI